MKTRSLVVVNKQVSGRTMHVVEAHEHRESEAATKCAKQFNYVELNKPFSDPGDARQFGIEKAKEMNGRFKNVRFITHYL